MGPTEELVFANDPIIPKLQPGQSFPSTIRSGSWSVFAEACDSDHVVAGLAPFDISGDIAIAFDKDDTTSPSGYPHDAPAGDDAICTRRTERTGVEPRRSLLAGRGSAAVVRRVAVLLGPVLHAARRRVLRELISAHAWISRFERQRNTVCCPGDITTAGPLEAACRTNRS